MEVRVKVIHPEKEAEKARNRVAIAAASVLFSSTYLIVATFASSRLLLDPDTFLHIAVGEWIMEHRTFPYTDVFSYTKFGQRWMATDWMSELIFATLYKFNHWLSVTEIVVLACSLISGVVTFYLARILRLSIALGLPVLMVLLISPHFLARPVIFSYVLLSIWLVIILDSEDQGWSGPWQYALIPVMVIWANIHGSFTFGLLIAWFFLCPAIFAAYLKKDVSRQWRMVSLLAATTAAALVTPYGPLSALRTFKLMSTPALAQIDEWHAPNFQDDPIHLASIICVFALLAYSGIRLRGGRLLTLVLVTIFALEYKRGLGLFGLVVPLLLARPASQWATAIRFQRVFDPVARFANRHVAKIAAACVATVIVAGTIRWATASPVPPNSTAPVNALAAAKRFGVSGHVLNSFGFGGYLIFNEIPTFIDGRVGLYGDAFLKRYFGAMRLTDAGEAAQLLKQYDVTWALLRPGEPIAFMLETDGWAQLYRDDSAIVFARRTKEVLPDPRAP
jgi:hypothetical protein